VSCILMWPGRHKHTHTHTQTHTMNVVAVMNRTLKYIFGTWRSKVGVYVKQRHWRECLKQV